nr:hypothetical protein OG999_09275 [Streptomyces sp. NBC_00886]
MKIRSRPLAVVAGIPLGWAAPPDYSATADTAVRLTPGTTA